MRDMNSMFCFNINYSKAESTKRLVKPLLTLSEVNAEEPLNKTT